jgi:hypothetical protein
VNPLPKRGTTEIKRKPTTIKEVICLFDYSDDKDGLEEVFKVIKIERGSLVGITKT